MSVPVELARILIRETNDSHVVELREINGERSLPIAIGICEAAAIERRLMGQAPPRPQTHELLENVIRQMGATIESVVISDLRHDEMGHGTFYARLLLRRENETFEIDSRPSDALALTAGTDVPLAVAEHVLDAVEQEKRPE